MFKDLKKHRLLASLLLCSFVTGCSSITVTEVTQIGTIKALDWPETVLVDSENDTIYISNIETIDMAGWADDGTGFISAVVDNGKIIRTRWVESRPWNLLNGPKGMLLKDNILYVADNKRLLSWPVKKPDPAKVTIIPGAQKLNDIAADELFMYVSDTAANTIYKIASKGGRIYRLKAPDGVNGIACFEDKLFAVSVTQGEIYEIDKTGKNDPRAVGLNKHFKGLDGIVFFEDGSSIVTDLRGSKLYSVDSDMEDVIELADVKWPANPGVDFEKKIIYVPQLKSSSVVKFQY